MEEIKALDDKGMDFIANEEGCVLHPYKDKAGIWTIGIGCTYYLSGARVQQHDPVITKAAAYSLFHGIVKHYETAVWSYTRDDISQNMFNGLVSLCYNIGPVNFKHSSVLKKVNNNPYDYSIRDSFLLWDKITDEVTGLLVYDAGLEARRKREAYLCLSKILP